MKLNAQNTVLKSETVPHAMSRSWPLLLEPCLEGNNTAWSSLFDELQPILIRMVKQVLGTNSQDQDLVDEIAARVWFTLVDRRFHYLRAFDPQLGVQLTTYLSGIAKTEWLQY